MKIIKPVFQFIKQPFRRLKVLIKQKAGWLGIPKIVPFRGFGNHMDVYIEGIVIEDKGLSKPLEANTIWQNILSMIKRFSSDEIPGVRVKAEFFGITKFSETDERGFFIFHFNVSNIPEAELKRNWHPVSFELLDDVVEDQPDIKALGIVRIISPEEKRIIVSDIDDTILISHSTQTMRKMWLMILKNAMTRLPFEGVASFYQALEKGGDNKSLNPFFYVSSSEWNLYDLLEDFFNHNNIPKGIFLLRRMEHSIYKFWKSGQGNHEHKYEKIKYLLTIFENQQFILIGDSGQKDPEIYKRLAMEFPGRIETIYIRKTGEKVYFQTIEQLNASLEKVKTSYLQVESTRDAARHAANNGYIHEDYFLK